MEDVIFEMVDEMLDMDGDIVIAGITFSRSYILRECDPTAYRSLALDFADSYIQDLQDELNSLDPVDDIDEVEDLKFRIAELKNI